MTTSWTPVALPTAALPMEYHPTMKLMQCNFFASNLDRFTGPAKTIEESANVEIRKKLSDLKKFMPDNVTKVTGSSNRDL